MIKHQKKGAEEHFLYAILFFFLLLTLLCMHTSLQGIKTVFLCSSSCVQRDECEFVMMRDTSDPSGTTPMLPVGLLMLCDAMLSEVVLYTLY